MQPINKLLLLVGLFIFNITANAQKRPIKYGKIDMSLMDMTELPGFESAPAAVICQYGEFDADRVQFTKWIRIKIFKKSGYDEANFVFNRINAAHSVRGKTFNLEGGEIVETKLTNEGIFEEEISDDFSRLKIAMPNVKVGSVIDIEFTFEGLPSEWYFQKTIPVVWNELRIEENPYVEYRKIGRGFEPLAEASKTRWVAKDMPAAIPEPYVDNINNYLTKFQIELSSITVPGYVYRDYSSSWGAVGGFYKNSTFFGDIMRDGSSQVKALAETIKSENLDPKERIERAIGAVRDKMKWNGIHADLATYHDIDMSAKRSEGNSADMNLFLAKLLKALDIEAEPFVLSTKDNGTIMPAFPTLALFNHAMVSYKLGDKVWVIDASDEYAPSNFLPPYCIGTEGRIITKDKISRIELKPTHAYKIKEVNLLTLDENGSLSGDITINSDGYAGYEFRKSFEGERLHKTYLESIYKGVEVSEVTVEGVDDLSKKIVEKRKYEAEDKLLNLDDSYYLDPMVFPRFSENPFKSSERKYPIDFSYPRSYSHSTQISLPSSMSIETLPSPIRLHSPDKSMTFSFNCSGFGDKIMLTYKIDISKDFYTVQEYPVIKEIFEQISTKLKEGIILKPKN